ncbi:glycoside hydrolase family 5 protein [Sphingomonas sp. LT1P40]|uniref:glycoside hydrolase family 5 protein n=1 Tax=Alteristakelama amylovorans TaxID=3096166 RepID=UPI002FCC919B
MMRILLTGLVSAGLATGGATAQTAKFDYTPALAAKPRTGIALPIGKCVNMANHLEAPTETSWGRAIEDADFTAIKAAGFDTIRLPVRWSAHADKTAPYAIHPAFLKRVKHLVATASGAGLNVILNLHHYEELYPDPPAHAVRFAALWDQIGTAFKDAPKGVWFELLNEPTAKLDHSNLLTILNPALANVRKTNPTRPVIIGGEKWSGVDSLATIPLPDDPYVVVTFHDYNPFPFTHQGASWIDPKPPLGRAFGPADKPEIDANLAKVRAFMKRTGRVPFMGEYGAIDLPAVPVEQRIAYYGAASAAYASIGVSSCAWGYTNTYRLRDGDKWIPGMIEAIRAPLP